MQSLAMDGRHRLKNYNPGGKPVLVVAGGFSCLTGVLFSLCFAQPDCQGGNFHKLIIIDIGNTVLKAHL